MKRKPAEPAKTGLAALSVRELETRLANERSAIDAAKDAGTRELKQVARAEMPAVHERAAEQIRGHADNAVALRAELEVRASRPIALPESWRGRARRAASGSGGEGVLAKAQAELARRDAEEKALQPPPDVPVRDGWDAVLPALPDNLAELGRRELGHLQVAHEQAEKLVHHRRGDGERLTDEQRHVELQIAKAELEILAGHVSGRWTRRDELLRQRLSRELDALLRTATTPPPKPRKADPRAASVAAAVTGYLLDGDKAIELVFGGITTDGKRNVTPILSVEDLGTLIVLYGLISRSEPDEHGLINLREARRRHRVQFDPLYGVRTETLQKLARTKLLAHQGDRIGFGPAALAIAKKAGVKLTEPTREPERVSA